MKTRKFNKLFVGALASIFIISILAFGPVAIRYFNGAVLINGTRDEVQLRVQGFSTQTNAAFVVEQSDGTDVFAIANDGTISSSAPAGSGDTTISGFLLVDGQADAIQTTIQGNATQTSDIFVVEESDGTDILNVTQIQGIDAGATGDLLEVSATTPVDTTGTNVHNVITCDVTIGNSTGGSNAVNCIQIDTIVEDAQIVETAIKIGDEWDIALDTNSPVIATAQTWFDDFMGSTVLAVYTEISGSDGQALQTIVEEQFGVYQLTSGDVGSNVAADGEGVYLSLNYQADQGSLVFETRLHLDTDIATVELCAGFTDDVTTVELPFTNASDTVTAVADSSIMFCFDTGSTTVEWFTNGAAAGTEATGIAAAGVAPTADIYQTLRIEIDDGGADCRFYIDGALVGTLTANCVTNTDSLAPGVIISSGGNAGSNVVDIDYIYASAGRD